MIDESVTFCSSSSSSQLSAAEVSYHVNVCDIDSPWEVHQVTTSQDALSTLQWDASGTRLLIVSTHGRCQIWAMKVAAHTTQYT